MAKLSATSPMNYLTYSLPFTCGTPFATPPNSSKTLSLGKMWILIPTSPSLTSSNHTETSSTPPMSASLFSALNSALIVLAVRLPGLLRQTHYGMHKGNLSMTHIAVLLYNGHVGHQTLSRACYQHFEVHLAHVRQLPLPESSHPSI
jgi:hypothetical protein